MQIVIDIPEETYKGIMIGKWDGNGLASYVKEGIILPKGHGRLIDANALLDTDRLIVDSMKCHYIPMMDIYDAPTIIEADKSESEGKE